MNNETKTKVSNLEGRNGAVKNQFQVITDKGRFFQSYDSIIVFIPNDGSKIQIDERYWDYSKTTGKYRNLFLGEDKKTTESKLKDGTYQFANLN